MPRVRLIDGPLDGCSVELIDDPRVGDVVPLSMSTASSPIYRVTGTGEARFSPRPPAAETPCVDAGSEGRQGGEGK